MAECIEIRDLAEPTFPSIMKHRDTPQGIQTLAEHRIDVTAYRERYNRRLERKRDARQTVAMAKDFIAWDGEGWTDTDGEHRYMYFANSLGLYVEYPLLSTQECINLIMDSAQKAPGAIHVIYGGGYDVTKILHDMPTRWRRNLRELGSVSWEGYKFEYVPHKWFTISGYHNERRTKITIYDVMTFFQTSFIQALQSRQIEVPNIVVTGKASRNDFTPDDLPMIKHYTGQELIKLVELCNTLRTEFQEAGIPNIKYHGPGAVANAVMQQYRIKNHMQEPTREIEYACQRAYFGGRFECFQAGHYEGPVFQADIRSAYPDKIRSLPSLKGARWEYRTEFTGELGIWRCSYESAESSFVQAHPLPWRSSVGSVAYAPRVEQVWLWLYEAVQATKIYEGYALILACDDLPFAFVSGMYDTRNAWKAEGRGGQWALKLALNSLYGKMAQRVGGKNNRPPKYHQLAWAGIVTSMTRAQLWEAMAMNPESVISVETDSICTTTRLDLPYGTALGQWDLSEYQWITYLQSGIYWTDLGGVLKIKTRGIGAKELTHDDVIAYLGGDQSESLRTMVRRFYSITNPNTAHYGQWLDESRELSVNGGKRHHVKDTCNQCLSGYSMADSLHRLVPAPMQGIGPSKPHPLPWVGSGASNVPVLDTAEYDHEYYEGF